MSPRLSLTGPGLVSEKQREEPHKNLKYRRLRLKINVVTMEERIGRFTLYNSPPFPSKTFTLIISLLLQQNATEITITLYGMDVVGDMSVVAVRRRLCPKWYQNKRVARKPFTFRHLCQPRTKPGSPDHSLGDGKHNDLGRGLGGGGCSLCCGLGDAPRMRLGGCPRGGSRSDRQAPGPGISQTRVYHSNSLHPSLSRLLIY